jgi:hypothetical protein
MRRGTMGRQREIDESERVSEREREREGEREGGRKRGRERRRTGLELRASATETTSRPESVPAAVNDTCEREEGGRERERERREGERDRDRKRY